MPIRSRLLAALWGLVLLASPVAADDFPVKILAAHIGLPPAKSGDREDAGKPSDVAKFAAWAPVYLDLQVNSPVSEPAEIFIEAVDPDEVNTSLAVPLNLSAAPSGTPFASATLGAIGYTRPAGVGEVTLTIRSANGGQVLSEPFRVRSFRPRDSLSYVVLALGPHIPGFDLPKPTTGSQDHSSFRSGRVDVTEISDFDQLPDRWFGYEAVDVLILNTSPGANDFIGRLFGDRAGAKEKTKREALVEWVRRGGRIVISVGNNAATVARLPALLELLPFTINPGTPTHNADILVLSWNAGEFSRTSTLSGALSLKKGLFPVANLVPKLDRPARVLVPTRERLKNITETIAAQAAYGLGRVTVLGFDLDRPPFLEFTQKSEFWDWVLREGGGNRAAIGSEGKVKPGANGSTEEEDELAVSLRTHNDTFDNIPVVSFGWVAVLIVLYTFLIGPIEFFFLKRVLGRLELTWITCPIIVLTVGFAAYFTANSIKGRDLNINKLDVIDVDPASQRVFGTTWFTVFSPRIEDYTLGLTPGEGWSTETEPTGTVLNWVGAPRGGRANLLRRSYHYHSGEDGLENVPIQVWSTKSFAANWSGSISGHPTIIESRLEHPPGDPSTVIGTFVNRLPVPLLTDCVAFYAGQAYPLPGGTIRSGETIRLVFDKGTLASQWLQKESRLEEVLRRVPSYAERPGAGKAAAGIPVPTSNLSPMDGSFPFWGVLFHESSLTYAEGVIPRNASLRRLDQSWRLDPANQTQVIFVGRVPSNSGAAEETLSGKSSPSRLWLNSIPGTGETRTPVPGLGRQETWVRVFLPVK